MKQIRLLFVFSTLFLTSVSISYGSSYQVTTDLTIRAVINTVEKGAIDAVWQKGGEETTTAGDIVIWGFFYANPLDVTWGSENNPDLYVKIWFDHGGRIDVNFFHVSVPDIDVYSEYSGSSNQYSRATMDNRYYRHEYNSNSSTLDVVGTWNTTSHSGDGGPAWITFYSDGTYTDNGVFYYSSYTVSGNNISGSHSDNDGEVTTWNGTISGNTMNINYSDSNGGSGSFTCVKQ